MDDDLPFGRYDSVITRRLAEVLDAEFAAREENSREQISREQIDSARMPEVLSRHLRRVAARVLADEADPAERVRILNQVLAELGAESDQIVGRDRLVAIRPPATPGAELHYTSEPQTPLSDVALLTNAAGEPSVGTELRSELHSVDRIDLLCASSNIPGSE